MSFGGIMSLLPPSLRPPMRRVWQPGALDPEKAVEYAACTGNRCEPLRLPGARHVADLLCLHLGLNLSPGAAKVPVEAACALSQMSHIAHFSTLPSSIIIYIDGGGADAASTAAWALAVFYRYACGRWVFRGYLTGPVQVDPRHHST